MEAMVLRLGTGTGGDSSTLSVRALLRAGAPFGLLASAIRLALALAACGFR